MHRMESGGVNLEAFQSSGPVVTAQTAPLEKRDQVYRDFLSLLSLYPRHRQDLLRRGLGERVCVCASKKILNLLEDEPGEFPGVLFFGGDC
jgi:hypothetical protein